MMSASRVKESHERKEKKRDMSKNATQKTAKNEAQAAVAAGVDGWVPGGQSTTRKEFSGKKITFSFSAFCLVSWML